MSMKHWIVITCACLLNAIPDATAQDTISKGPLFIVGGGLQADAAEIWSDFIASAKSTGPIVIIPSASGQPVQSAEAVRKTLLNYGVPKNRIEIAPLALRDDLSTGSVDESDWADNAQNSNVVNQLSSAAAFWFTGGDQARTTQLLLENGQDTPALSAIRTAYANGAAIGGTSAGAAIMSERMILQGDSLGALIGEDSGELLEVAQGLGFLKGGLIDQHFGERARLGRLAMAVFEIDNRVGFGVDEDTALIINHDGMAKITGTDYVTIIDARNAKRKLMSDHHVAISDVTLQLVSAGDKIDLKTLDINPAAWKAATVGNEYISTARSFGGGMAVAGQMLQDVIGEGLIDNADSKVIERLSFDGSNQGLIYRFTQPPEASGHWGRGSSGEGRYTIKNIEFDIRPIRMAYKEIVE